MARARSRHWRPAWRNGFSDGYSNGYDEGYAAGEQAGYSAGYAAGQTDGYAAGYDAGYLDGLSEGYAAGFGDGQSDGVQTCTQEWTDAVSGLLGQPVAGLEEAISALDAIVHAQVLLTQSELPAAALPECYYGGVQYAAGRDIGGSGTLGPDEIEATIVECTTDPDVLDASLIIDSPEGLSFAQPYEIVTGSVQITGLPNVDGLSLVSVGDFVGVTGSTTNNIDGLSSLRETAGLILIDTALTNVDALALLTSNPELNVTFNEQLTNLAGLSSLVSADRLVIFGNPSLTDLDGLSSVTTLTKTTFTFDADVNIGSNQVLESLDGLHSIAEVTADSLAIFITNNANLSDCQVEGFLQHIQSVDPGLQLFVTTSGNLPCEAPSTCVYWGPGPWQGGTCQAPPPPP